MLGAGPYLERGPAWVVFTISDDVERRAELVRLELVHVLHERLLLVQLHRPVLGGGLVRLVVALGHAHLDQRLDLLGQPVDLGLVALFLSAPHLIMRLSCVSRARRGGAAGCTTLPPCCSHDRPFHLLFLVA